MIEKIQSYEDLIVYQRSFELALTLHKVSLTFPKIEQFALADQLRRASKSICANVAEGFSRRSHSVAEFKRFLVVAFGSAEETRVWIRFAHRLGYLEEKTANNLLAQYLEICKMLRALNNSWQKS